MVEKIIGTEARIKGINDLWSEGERVYSFLNPVSYLDALKHKELFNQMDGLFADGALMVLAIRMLYGVKVTRRSLDMTSLAPILLSYAVNNKKSVYIVASKQEEIDRAIVVILEAFKGINIIGYRNGYFSNEEESNREAKHIADLDPDFVLVGMKAISREKFLLMIKEAGFRGIGFSCGGFIHQTAHGKAQYYPEWVNRMNLRFVYRMWKEPHTRMRYLRAGVLFPIIFLWDKYCNNEKK